MAGTIGVVVGFFFLTVLSPAVLLTLLSYIFSFDLDTAKLAIIDQDQSPQSHEYLRTLTADGNLTMTEGSPEEIERD